VRERVSERREGEKKNHVDNGSRNVARVASRASVTWCVNVRHNDRKRFGVWRRIVPAERRRAVLAKARVSRRNALKVAKRVAAQIKRHDCARVHWHDGCGSMHAVELNTAQFIKKARTGANCLNQEQEQQQQPGHSTILVFLRSRKSDRCVCGCFVSNERRPSNSGVRSRGTRRIDTASWIDHRRARQIRGRLGVGTVAQQLDRRRVSAHTRG
jgi:hypothetical protein